MGVQERPVQEVISHYTSILESDVVIPAVTKIKELNDELIKKLADANDPDEIEDLSDQLAASNATLVRIENRLKYIKMKAAKSEVQSLKITD